MFVQFTSEYAETKHCHICFLQRPCHKLQYFKSNKMMYPYFSTISYRLKKKKKWMPQNKVGKLTSCTHWWEKRSLTSFYILDLFQTITANVAIETKIFNDDALFEGAICQDFRLTLCTVVCNHLRKCGSCHIVSRTV